MNNMKNILSEQSELGKKTAYDAEYNPGKLFPIARIDKRQEIGIRSDKLPFYGFDCWNHYEVSWLNTKGKPMIAIAEIIYGCESPYIIESKSMKLYFIAMIRFKIPFKVTLKNTLKHLLVLE